MYKSYGNSFITFIPGKKSQSHSPAYTIVFYLKKPAYHPVGFIAATPRFCTHATPLTPMTQENPISIP